MLSAADVPSTAASGGRAPCPKLCGTAAWAASAVRVVAGLAPTRTVYTWSKLGCSKQVAHSSALNRSAWDVTRCPTTLSVAGPSGLVVTSACWVASAAQESLRESWWERLMGVVGGVGICPSEVKFLDRAKTIISESIRQVHLSQSRTKVGGSKMIRYRRSPDCKRCQPGIGRRRMDGPPGTPGET